ncbi:hypothetical protein [Streptomyces sp. NPDC002889]|uniref:hypothetical protein n=1 Tax=Streptomyces sp. NPDC002889 TaxID=3364669 RepID=UPI0036B46F31
MTFLFEGAPPAVDASARPGSLWLGLIASAGRRPEYGWQEPEKRDGPRHDQ